MTTLATSGPTTPLSADVSGAIGAAIRLAPEVLTTNRADDWRGVLTSLQGAVADANKKIVLLEEQRRNILNRKADAQTDRVRSMCEEDLDEISEQLRIAKGRETTLRQGVFALDLRIV
jgi:hypothetical protein